MNDYRVTDDWRDLDVYVSADTPLEALIDVWRRYYADVDPMDATEPGSTVGLRAHDVTGNVIAFRNIFELQHLCQAQGEEV